MPCLGCPSCHMGGAGAAGGGCLPLRLELLLGGGVVGVGVLQQVQLLRHCQGAYGAQWAVWQQGCFSGSSSSGSGSAAGGVGVVVVVVVVVFLHTTQCTPAL
jgi:hypothetical protein